MILIGGGVQLVVTLVTGTIQAIGFIGSHILPPPILRFLQRECKTLGFAKWCGAEP